MQKIVPPTTGPKPRGARRLATLLTPVLLTLLAPPALGQDLYLQGGWLVDPETETVRRADLWIEDGRIAGMPEAPPADFDGQVLDVEGQFLLPALRDLHVHSMVQQAPGGVFERLGTPETSRRMLHAGVVGFLDLFSPEDMILGLRDRQRQWLEDGKQLGSGPMAEIFAAGPCLTATNGHCTEYPIPTRVIDSPADARREIAQLAAKRPDVVKLVYEHVDADLRDQTWRQPRPTLDRPTLQAAIDTAREFEIPTVIHIRSWQDVVDVVEAGASAVTHLPSYGELPEGLATRMAEQGTVVIPTLALADTALASDAALLEGDLVRRLAGETILAAYRGFDTEAEAHRPLVRGLAAAQVQRRAALAQLASAGVPIVAGTDSGNPWTVHGFSLHRELEFYVEAGLTPWQALASATINAGRFLDKSWGLEVGDEGTVLVLEASPVEDIRNTRRLVHVVQRGQLVPRGPAPE